MSVMAKTPLGKVADKTDWIAKRRDDKLEVDHAKFFFRANTESLMYSFYVFWMPSLVSAICRF